MSAKLSALRKKLASERGDHPYVRMFRRGCELLLPPYYIGTDPDQADVNEPDMRALPDDTQEHAREVLRLREYKAFAAAFSAAVDGYLKQVELELYEKMQKQGPRRFECDGMMFGPTHTNIVKARPELGGTGNPDLKQWFIDVDLPDIAAGTINANTMKSAVNEWMKNHPTTAVKAGEHDDEELRGEELLSALGIDQEELDERLELRGRLDGMLEIGQQPTLSVRKVT